MTLKKAANPLVLLKDWRLSLEMDVMTNFIEFLRILGGFCFISQK